MSYRLPFGEHEGRTLQQLAADGDWPYIIWLLTLVKVRVNQPALYHEAWRLFGEYVKAGGQPPAIWQDDSGQDRFLTAHIRPGMKALPIFSVTDRAIVSVLEEASAGLPKATLIKLVIARLPRSADDRQDRRHVKADRAINRLRKRGALSIDHRGQVTRTNTPVTYPNGVSSNADLA